MFVVSLAGQSQWLSNPAEGEAFLNQWQFVLEQQVIRADSPAIRYLIYAAYEASILFERLPEPVLPPPGGLLWLHQPEWSLCFDAQQGCIHLSSTVGEKQLNQLESWLNQVTHQPVSNPLQSPDTHEKSCSDYCESVKKVIRYIEAGDIFQANIARYWNAPFPVHHLKSLYQRLRAVNPAPFACFVKMGELNILSASPERLFRISTAGRVDTRPIAGTRKRSGHRHGDQQLRDELLLSEKERAEHLMLVDLERNDLGRICEPGSVHVDEMMTLEAYATVHHIVSNVSGQLRPGLDFVDVLKAMFPGGTITGCPKIRCMEIIHELEMQPRGPYTGGVGYLAWDGSADMNILIRTFWHHRDTLNWAAGAGIVADSIPLREREETEHKAAGLLRAL